MYQKYLVCRLNLYSRDPSVANNEDTVLRLVTMVVMMPIVVAQAMIIRMVMAMLMTVLKKARMARLIVATAHQYCEHLSHSAECSFNQSWLIAAALTAEATHHIRFSEAANLMEFAW